MKRKHWLIALGLCAFVVAGCPRYLFVDDLWYSSSPDGELVAYLLRSDFQGATSSFDYSIVVTAKDEVFSKSRSYPTGWSSTGCPPAYVFWRGPRLLVVLLPPATPRCSDEPLGRRTSKEGVVVETLTLDSLDWAGVEAAMARSGSSGR